MSRSAWAAGVLSCVLAVQAVAGWICDGVRESAAGTTTNVTQDSGSTVYYSNENIDRCGTTGVFDENVFAKASISNVVGDTSLEEFREAVAAAWSNDLGGVIDWDTGVEYAKAGAYGNGLNWLRRSGVTVSYGASGTNVLMLVFSDVSSMELFNWKTFTALSGGADGRRQKIATDGTAEDPTLFTMGFTYTNGDAWPLTAVGVGVMAFETRTIDVTARFSDATEVTQTNTFTTNGHTLFYFEAPAGKTINSLTFDGTAGTGQRRIVVDDIGFIGAEP